ncbi:MAG: glycosyltransferase [Pseudomonadota bacterium]|nr:glycosyltransferase [Pseudomonadota bacterium]
MSETKLDDARILIYSHDTFGLGHLRRCRTIAHSLVEYFRGLKVLIVSGSPIIGSFDFKARVDFVRIPGVVKLRGGDYTALSSHTDLTQTLQMRSSIIEQTAKTFAPDLLIVDKEPLGLRGEVRDTIELLRARGTRTVLGLRDIMDDPVLLRQEWKHREIPMDLERLYDEIWVYGVPAMGDPLLGIDISQASRERMVYTGYLERHLPEMARNPVAVPDKPFLLVTPGGGGDGETLVDWVLRACEEHARPDLYLLIALGPFMSQSRRYDFQRRAAALEHVQTLTFHPNIELLIARAAGIVAMGGYNIFCEILSLDKRALLVPRSMPRMEQTLRARRAEELGLVDMLQGDGDRSSIVMARALQTLGRRPVPSKSGGLELLTGVAEVRNRVQALLTAQGVPSLRSVAS